MTTESPDKDPANSSTGGCSLGCAGIFILVGLLFPLSHLFGGTWEGGEMMLLPVAIGLPSFIAGHFLAITAIDSGRPHSRRAGKLALLLIWGSIGSFFLIGLVGIIFL